MQIYDFFKFSTKKSDQSHYIWSRKIKGNENAHTTTSHGRTHGARSA